MVTCERNVFADGHLPNDCTAVWNMRKNFTYPLPMDWLNVNKHFAIVVYFSEKQHAAYKPVDVHGQPTMR